MQQGTQHSLQEDKQQTHLPNNNLAIANPIGAHCEPFESPATTSHDKEEEDSAMGNKHSWLPMESDPETLNKVCSQTKCLALQRYNTLPHSHTSQITHSSRQLARNFGMDSSQWQIVELFGLDEENLSILPQPVVGLILLYPDIDTSSSSNKNDNNTGQQIQNTQKQYDTSSDIFFIQQVPELDNACGTIALIHTLTNNIYHGVLDPNALLRQFMQQTQVMSPNQKGQTMSRYKPIHKLHHHYASVGLEEVCSGAAPPAKRSKVLSWWLKPGDVIEVVHHYVSFVCIKDKLVELDGMKPAPIVHMKTSPTTFLKDASQLIEQKYFSKYGGIQFNLMALCGNN